MAALSYLGANWILVILVVLGTIALGYVSFILKNWKLAVAAVALVSLGLAYQKVNMDGYKRRVNEEAQAQVKLLTNRLNTVAAINQAYSKRYADDQKNISELESKASVTPKNSHRCFGAAASRRVRAIR